MIPDGMAGGMDWMMGGMGVLSLLILILVCSRDRRTCEIPHVPDEVRKIG